MKIDRRNFIQQNCAAIGSASLYSTLEVVIKIEVKDNNIEQALRVLKRKLQRDGFFKVIKLKNTYEKPSEKKKRILLYSLSLPLNSALPVLFFWLASNGEDNDPNNECSTAYGYEPCADGDRANRAG